MELNTERLTLRDFLESDWPDVLAYQSDPLYLRYNRWDDRRPEEVHSFVQMFLEQQQQEPRIKFQLAVVLKTEDRLIGNCGIRKDSAEAHEADIGYELSPDYWGRGFATEAVRAILNFGFTKLKAHRISAWCIAENTASVRVLEKAGLQREGRLRDKEYFKGRFWDVLLYAILIDEWNKRSK